MYSFMYMTRLLHTYEFLNIYKNRQVSFAGIKRKRGNIFRAQRALVLGKGEAKILLRNEALQFSPSYFVSFS